MQKIGVLQSIYRYPVKSMRGEELTTAIVTENGIYGDRVYAFLDESNRTGVPWLTARQFPFLILYSARLAERPESRDDVKVFTPEGTEFDISDRQLLDDLRKKSGRVLHLKYSKKGYFDSKRVSIFGLSTIEQLGREVGTELDRRRFRANFYVDWANKEPYLEDSLVDREINIGDARFHILKRISRCVIITLDPKDAAPKTELLKCVVKAHNGCAGVYAEVAKAGRVNAGDSVTLLDAVV